MRDCVASLLHLARAPEADPAAFSFGLIPPLRDHGLGVRGIAGSWIRPVEADATPAPRLDIHTGSFEYRDYPWAMTREQAIDEVARRRISDPEATWIAAERGNEWIVARIGLEPDKPTGTATKPPPVAPRDDPHSPIERAAWFAAGG